MDYTLITGASYGIGEALARRCAGEGFNLILVARSAEQLEALAQELAHEFEITVHPVACDLLAPHAAEELYQTCCDADWPVRILINNAGAGVWGSFAEVPLSEQLATMRLNEQVLVELCYRFLPMLQAATDAHILNVGSTASYQPLPYFSVYAATKAFVRSFTRSLRVELQPMGVNVTCLNPGPTQSQFFRRAGFTQVDASQFLMDPAEVADGAVRGLLAHKPEVVPGFSNQLGTYLSKYLPPSLTQQVIKTYFKPRGKDVEKLTDS
ncbi:MAG: SDR family oxidoreductase [Tunicatimonas sp.]